MDASRTVRRLTAIVALDVCGFSRMMRVDEEGTLALLKRHRRELIDPKITEFRGRVVRNTGDGLLAEFYSAVDALRCSVDIQRAMAERNTRSSMRTDLRIGVNVGDVIIDDGDIFGDVVNIAARLEGVAPVGGICISDRVREDAAGKVDVEFEDGGLQQLKNIDRPVHVYRVRFGTPATEAAISRSTAVDMSIPAKPSIVVMPLRNAGGDPEHDYLADGLTGEIITSLSRYPSLFVVAQGTSFAYKGQPSRPRRVAGELGVKFVMEGGVRHSDNQLGFGIRLYEGESGDEVWVGRYDREEGELFASLHEATQGILSLIAPEVGDAEHAQAARKRPDDIAAYQLALMAWVDAQRAWLGPDAALRESALRTARQALAIDPRNTRALGTLAMVNWQNAFIRGTPDVEEAITEGLRCARLAIQHDRSDHWGYVLKAMLLALSGSPDAWSEAVEDCRRAQELNPNDALTLYALGWMEAISGNAVPAIEHLRQFLRCNPHDAWVPNVHVLLSLASFVCADYRAGIEWAQRAPDVPMAVHNRAACHIGLGELDLAARATQEARELSPESLEARLAGTSVFRRPEDRQRHTIFLRVAAGLEDAEVVDDLR